MARKRGDRRWPFLIGLLIVCIVLAVLHRRIEKAGHTDLFSSGIQQLVVAPGARSTHATGRWFQTYVFSLVNGPRLARENLTLKAQVQSLRQQNSILLNEEAENVRLRTLLNLKARTTRTLTAAEVLLLRPLPERDTAIIGIGSLDHVRLKEPVIDGSGSLVGQVILTTSTTATILLLTDVGSSVGAEVVPVGRKAGTEPVFGVCDGNRSRDIELSDVPGGSDVRVGDKVVTSGLGTVYGQGIPIGTITQVRADNARYLVTAAVKTNVDFDHLQEVFLEP